MAYTNAYRLDPITDLGMNKWYLNGFRIIQHFAWIEIAIHSFCFYATNDYQTHLRSGSLLLMHNYLIPTRMKLIIHSPAVPLKFGNGKFISSRIL